MVESLEFFRATFSSVNQFLLFCLLLLLPVYLVKWRVQLVSLIKTKEGSDLSHQQACWCIVASMTLLNWFGSVYTDDLVLSLSTDYITKRKLFYLCKMLFVLFAAASLYALHKFTQVHIEQPSKLFVYMLINNLTLCFIQFILRGYEITEIFNGPYLFMSMFVQTLVHMYIVCHPYREFLSKSMKLNL
ncbi:hypothetical protein N482_01930 [Pseudoalteromonas luteoviolacea NCIMB 1942]|uniref:Uncharacterized protein n=1 Tax=Pseudoalteromonas luteoviolacea NCIMB 1942 TaxID=1365253 RepID=A0A167BX39_9GAMM|nr:hypothetical protein N482_01930 [Pseudoalteromonas luteoviolacea NCIMB 1942]